MEGMKWTEKEVLKTIGEKAVIDINLKKRRWQMIGHTLRYEDELNSIIIGGIIKETQLSSERSTTIYIG